MHLQRIDSLILLFSYFGVSIIETWLLWFFLKKFLHIKEDKKKYLLIAQLVYFLYQFLTYLFSFPLFSSAPITYLLCLIITYLFYDDSAYFRVMTIHLFIILNYACRLLSLTIFSYIGDMTFTKTPLPVLSPFVQLLAYFLVFVFTYLMIWLRKLQKSNRPVGYHLLMIALPALYLLTLAALISIKSDTLEENLLYYFCFGFCLLALAFTLFYHLDQLVIIDKNNHHIQLTNEILEANKKNYARILESQEEILRQKHDFLKHLNTIQYMCATRQSKQAEKYISSLLEHPAYRKQTIHTSNSTIDSILNISLNRLKQAGVKFKYRLMIPPALPFDDVDLCIILSNLLTNASEACLRMPDKDRDKAYVYINITQKKSFLLIEVANTFQGEILVENGLYLSEKRKKQNPGIGLTNVEMTVEKYNGVMKIQHENSIFKVKIILPFSE